MTTQPQYAKPSVQQVWGNTNTSATDMIEPPTIAGGEASMPTGFIESTTAPARQFFNWLFNYITNGVRYFSQRGIPDWDANESYYQGSRIQATDGNTYACISVGPISSNPVSGGQTDWVLWGLTQAQLNGIGGFFTSGDIKYSSRIVVPAGWLLANGSAVSRATYATLFAAVTYVVTGALTNGNNVLTYSASTVTPQIGWYVSGPGLAGGVVTISNVTGTQLTLSANATAGEAAGTSFVLSPWPLGDGSTTFNLPQLCGPFIRGYDAAGTYDAGRVFGSIELDSYKAHTHTITDPGHTHTITDPGHSHYSYATATPINAGTTGYYAVSYSGSYTATTTNTTGITVNAATTGITATNTSGSATETRPVNVALLALIKT